MNVPKISAYLLHLILMPFLVFASIQSLNNTQPRTWKYLGHYFTKLSGQALPLSLPITTPGPNLFPQPPQFFSVVTDNEPLAPGQAFALPVVPPKSLPSSDPASQSGLPPFDTGTQIEPFQTYPTISPDTAAFPSFGLPDDDMPDNGLPPFPSQLPPLLTAGIASVTSPGFTLPTDFGIQPPSALAQRFPSFIPLPSATNNVLDPCTCVPAGTCVTLRGGNGVINVRIVTQNQGAGCAAGQQYCCSQNTNQPQTESCGIQNIIPGVTPAAGQANFGEFPWSGIIMDSSGYVGGAALIDPYHLLTAAHLVSTKGNGAGMIVRLGEWDISGTYEPVAHVEYAVAGIVIHPSFVASTLQNDLAIIRLTGPATILTAPTPQVNTVCLPATGDVFTGIGCFVAGWGKDSFAGNYQNIIKKVDVPVLGNADCQTRLRTTRLGPNYALDTTSFICAGGELAKDACQGDGGNALVCGNNGKYFVAGITAGGVNCGQQGIPGLYVHVSSYLAWIAQQTANVPTVPGTIDPRRG